MSVQGLLVAVCAFGCALLAMWFAYRIPHGRRPRSARLAIVYLDVLVVGAVVVAFFESSFVTLADTFAALARGERIRWQFPFREALLVVGSFVVSAIVCFATKPEGKEKR